MTTDACRDWRGALGAAALGGIGPAEEIAFRAHLDGCATCRAELRDLTAVAQALAVVPIESVTSAPVEPSRALADRVFARVVRERAVRRGRRTRRALVGVGTAAVAAAAVISVVLLVAGGGPASGTNVVLNSAVGASARATLHARPVGTEVDVRFAGLHPGQYYWLWLTGDDGHRIPAGSFTGSNHSTEVQLMAAVPLTEARRIWVTDGRDAVVLDAHIPTGSPRGATHT
ncbi:MAG TPA: anti-sigma factor [Acidimicrobiia bacterium]|nr:anti-sigma factor [Acidimicrobiia bacterium]